MSSDRAREAYRELQQLARADYGGATGSLLVVYGVEGFLRRLAASDYATKMTLKGGMLMAATAARRMTKDADLSTFGVANDPDHIAQVVADIVTVELADDDGLAFEVSTIRTEAMREQADYQGVRVKIEVRLATARPTGEVGWDVEPVDDRVDGDGELLPHQAMGGDQPVGLEALRVELRLERLGAADTLDEQLYQQQRPLGTPVQEDTKAPSQPRRRSVDLADAPAQS